MLCPPSGLYALCAVVHVHRHVAKLLMCVNYAEHSILLNHLTVRVLVRAPRAAGVRGEGRTCLRERTAGQTRGTRVEWGLCEAAAAAAGPLAAHRVRQKQKATRTHLRYKAWSRRNHETGSVGGKQTERTANSSQPNLHSPLLIQVWNLINSSEKVNKAFFVRLLHIR